MVTTKELQDELRIVRKNINAQMGLTHSIKQELVGMKKILEEKIYALHIRLEGMYDKADWSDNYEETTSDEMETITAETQVDTLEEIAMELGLLSPDEIHAIRSKAEAEYARQAHENGIFVLIADYPNEKSRQYFMEHDLAVFAKSSSEKRGIPSTIERISYEKWKTLGEGLCDNHYAWKKRFEESK